MNTENNKLIAEFMGAYREPLYNGIDNSIRTIWRFPNRSFDDYIEDFENETPYHTDWNWLMPVVEKIESIRSEHHGYFGVHISSNSCTVQGTKFRSDKIDINNPVYVNDAYGENKLLATYNACVQFIQWYNQTTHP